MYIQLLFETGRLIFEFIRTDGEKATFEQAIIVKAVAQGDMQQFGLEAFHKCRESFASTL